MRRADQQQVVTAGTIKGLFPVDEAPDRPRASPPPLPTADVPHPTPNRSEPPPLPSSKSRLDGLGEGLRSFGEASKAAARLAAAQARKTHLEKIALPAAYGALGRDTYASGRFREEFPEMFAEIGELERQIELIASTRSRVRPAEGLADRATGAAAGVKAAAQAKALSLKKELLLRRLGESSFAKHEDRSGPEALVRPIAEYLARIGGLAEEAHRQSKTGQGRIITPRRVLMGSIGLGFAAILLAGSNMRGSNEGRPEGADATGGVRGGLTVGGAAGAVGVPDFSKVDYTYDFSKDDYETIPTGAKQQRRSKVIERSNIDEIDAQDPERMGKLMDEEGYTDAEGKFVRQGLRIIWFEKNRREKYLEDRWLGGKRHGLLIDWWKGGKKAAERTYVNGQVHGESRLWYENGQMRLRTSYLHGKEHGVHTEWYPSGKKKEEVAWVDGRGQGTFMAWYETGQPKERSDNRDGKYVGRRTQWFSNGAVRSELDYDNGSLILRPGDAVGAYLEMMAFLTEHHPDCDGRFPIGMNCDERAFLQAIGRPDSDIGLVGRRRQWGYRCRDGVLSLTVSQGASRIIVHEIGYTGRANPITPLLTKRQFREALGKIEDRGGSRPWFDGEEFLDTFGFPASEQSLNGTGNKEYVYLCKDGIIGLDVQVFHREVTPQRLEVGRIMLKDIDEP